MGATLRAGIARFQHQAIGCFVLAVACTGTVAVAHEDHVGPLEEIVVYGRSAEQLGVAAAASSGPGPHDGNCRLLDWDAFFPPVT